jgi:hypothetical protein
MRRSEPTAERALSGDVPVAEKVVNVASVTQF